LAYRCGRERGGFNFGSCSLRRIQSLIIPAFVSTEEAMVWGSDLNPEQRATLLDIQRSVSNAARAEADPQHMINLATQSQLMREAAEAAPSNCHIRR
jgi:hypothetical protein